MSITTILNCYRRPYNLPDQLEAIRNQTIPTDEIWLWINCHEDNREYDYSNLGIDKIVYSSFNFKFHGRFALGLLAQSDHLAYFDDDTIPGTKWFENCIETETRMKTAAMNAPPILGSAGVRLLSSSYVHHQRVGWPSKNVNIQQVDLVGHAWFFNRQILNCLWSSNPISLQNGEDIQLSFLAQKKLGSITYCPPHPKDDIELWGSTRAEELGIDSKATSNNNEVSHQQFFAERDQVIRVALDNGWKTLYNVH